MSAPLLSSIAIKRMPSAENMVFFPYTVPTIAGLEPISFTSPVCFFVGENGSGKSTLLEGMAAAALLPAIGAAAIDKDVTLDAQRSFGRNLRLSWTRLAHRGFFLRAEDFFGYAKELSRARAEALRDIEEIAASYDEQGRSEHAKALALGPHMGSLAAMEEKYGRNLDENSHGQSFLQLFRSRLAPQGLYLMDEPEAPLSPQSQLAFLAMVHDAVVQGSQFIIATHSPMLLAYPGAQIISFDSVPVRETEFADLEHVNLTREFLANPDRFLRRLFATEGRP